MSHNISMHSDSELADLFDNDEYLYGIAMNATSFNELDEIASELFIFNSDQLVELKTDWMDGRWS